MGDRGRRRTPSPGPALAAPAGGGGGDAPRIAFSRDNMAHLFCNIDDLVKLVEVERLLQADAAARGGGAEPPSVLRNVLVRFKHGAYHLGLIVRYVDEDRQRDGQDMVLVQSGHVGSGAPAFLRIPVFSVSSHNPLAEEQWRQRGEGELRALQEYGRLHNRCLTLQQAAESAWRRQASLEWFGRYQGEDDLAPYLPRLLSELRDGSEVQRLARRFQLEPSAPALAPVEPRRRRRGASPAPAPQPATEPRRRRRGASPVPAPQPAASRRMRRDSPPRERRRTDSPPRERRRANSPPRERRRADSPLRLRSADALQQRVPSGELSPRGQERQRRDGKFAPLAAAPQRRGSDAKSSAPAIRSSDLPATAAGVVQPQQPPQQLGEPAAPSGVASILPSFIDLGPVTAAPVAASDGPTGPTTGAPASSAAQPEQRNRPSDADVRAARDAALAARARDPAAPSSAQPSDVPPGGKRKRPIEWAPQESQPGDAPLAARLAKPPAAEAGAPSPAKLARVAAADAKPGTKPDAKGNGKRDSKPDGKPGGRGDAKADAKAPPAAKQLTITVKGAAKPPKGPLADAGERHARAASHERAAQRPPSRPPSRGADDDTVPPGFGSRASTPQGGHARSAGAGHGVVVRVRLPGAFEGDTFAERVLPVDDDAQPAAPAAGGALADRFGFNTAQQRLLLDEDSGAAAGAPAARPQPDAPPPQGLHPALAAGVLPVVSDAWYDGTGLAASPAALAAYAQQLEQLGGLLGQQQMLLPAATGLQVAAGYGGGLGAQLGGDDSHGEGQYGEGQYGKRQYGFEQPDSPPARGRRVSRVDDEADDDDGGGGGGRRVVELDDGGGRAAPGGSRGGGQRAGGGFWDPMWCWERDAVELLHERQLSLDGLQQALPLPPCWDPAPDALASYVARRKQLFWVGQSQRGRRGAPVRPAAGARAFLQFKRALLQALADGQPRTDAGAARLAAALPPAVDKWVRREAEADFARFVVKFFGLEVDVTRAGDSDARLLELRPFDVAATGGGGGHPPIFRGTCHSYAQTGRCKHGHRCFNSHAPPRCWSDKTRGKA